MSVAALAVATSCTTTQASTNPPAQQPSPSTVQGGTQVQPSTTVTTGAPGAVAGQTTGGQQGAAPPRRGPNPIAQDSTRRAQVDSIMRTIAGRETQPAGTVFKNVKLLKDMPAGEFLKNMDVNYGRGLGMGCGNCHVVGQYDQDTRKNKRIARQMQEMTDYINKSQMPNVKELDEDYPKVTCVMCHMGSAHPKNTMAVPQPSTAPPR
jgi:hypothetical protein